MDTNTDPADDLRDALTAYLPYSEGNATKQGVAFGTRFDLTAPSATADEIVRVYPYDGWEHEAIALGWAYAEAARRGWFLQVEGPHLDGYGATAYLTPAQLHGHPEDEGEPGRGFHPSSPAVAALLALTAAAVASAPAAPLDTPPTDG